MTKPTGSDSDYWTGGDALTVDINGVKPDPEDPNGVSGIDITVKVTFEETEEEVEVPVTPGTGGGDDPDPKPDPNPDAEKPTITFPQASYTLPADASKNADAVIVSTAEGGIQSVVVKIAAGNTGFGALTPGLGFDSGVELVGNTTLGPIISDIVSGLEMPQAGDTKYTFPVGGFFTILQGLGVTTDPDGHVFDITVKDANGEASSSLSVKVTE